MQQSAPTAGLRNQRPQPAEAYQAVQETPVHRQLRLQAAAMIRAGALHQTIQGALRATREAVHHPQPARSPAARLRHHSEAAAEVLQQAAVEDTAGQAAVQEDRL